MGLLDPELRRRLQRAGTSPLRRAADLCLLVATKLGGRSPGCWGLGQDASWLLPVLLRGSKMCSGRVDKSWKPEPTPASEVRSQCQVTEQPANRQEQVLSLLLPSSLPLISLQLEPPGELSVKGEMHLQPQHQHPEQRTEWLGAWRL